MKGRRDREGDMERGGEMKREGEIEEEEEGWSGKSTAFCMTFILCLASPTTTITVHMFHHH